MCGTLGSPSAQDQRPLDERVLESNDVRWLERLVESYDYASEQTTLLDRNKYAKPSRVRIFAYVRLGAMGTSDSLAALQRVESKLRDAPLLPEVVSLLRPWPHPTFHISDFPVEPLAETRIGTRSYALVRSNVLGIPGWSVLWREPDSKWVRPRLAILENPGLRNEGKSLGAGSFLQDRTGRVRMRFPELVYIPEKNDNGPTGRTSEVALENVLRDTDRDGWTDT